MGPRRVVVGSDETGIACVVSDAAVSARIVRPNGATVQELWRQDHLPAVVAEFDVANERMSTTPPQAGASIRLFTVPPSRPTAHADNGVQSETPAGSSQSSSLYVATVLAGNVVLVLESGDVSLSQGDTLILPGSPHSWRNDSPSTVSIVTTVFALQDDQLADT